MFVVVNLTLTVLLLSGSPVPDNDPENAQDLFKPEQLSPNNSVAVTQQPSEQPPTTTRPTESTTASEKTDIKAETTTPPPTEPKITDADNPEKSASESDDQNPQSVFELEQLSNSTVPPEMASTRLNSTPTSDQSDAANSQSSSELKPTLSATAQTDNPDLNPVQPENRQDPEVNLENQTEAPGKPSENTTLGRSEILTTVSTPLPTTAKITEQQTEHQEIRGIVTTKPSPTYPALTGSTPASEKVRSSPTKAQENPTKPNDSNNSLQGLQDYQAGKDSRILLLFLIHSVPTMFP